MKFNQERVAKIAIDTEKHQQLYVSSSPYNYKLIPMLEEMGYDINYKELLCQPDRYIFIINTIDQKVFRTRGNTLAQALPSGGKLLDIFDLLTLIDFWMIEKYNDYRGWAQKNWMN